MVENGYVTPEEGDEARAEPLNVNPRVLSPNTNAAGYFAEEVRRELLERYGEKKLYEGGLSVRATLDPKMQLMARKALADGLVRFDEAHGFRGPIKQIDISATGARRSRRSRRSATSSPGASPSCSRQRHPGAIGLQPRARNPARWRASARPA